jgi:cell division protease FtsH
MGHMKNYSESTAVDIDNEIRRIVTENYQTTRALIRDHQEQLIALSELLLEKETLDSSEILDIVFPGGLPDHIAPKEEEGSPADQQAEGSQTGDDFSFEAATDSSASQQDKEEAVTEASVEDTETAVEASEDEIPKS